MKNLILVVSVLNMMLVTALQAQSCPIPEPLDKSEVIGTWKGSYLENGYMKPITFRITKKGETLKTEIAFEPSEFSLAETVLCPREDLHLKITKNGKSLEFIGRPSKGKLAGRVVYVDEQNKRVSDLYSLTKK